MFNIIVYGKKNDSVLSKVIINALEKYGGVQYSLDNEINCSKDCASPLFLLYDIAKMNKSINMLKGCIVFKDSFDLFEPALFPSHFTPIFDAKNKELQAALSKTDKIAITCGTSPKDTLSLASISEDKAVISLQRYIKTFNSNIIEPHDFTIKLSKNIGVYELLSACAVLLLAEVLPNNGYII